MIVRSPATNLWTLKNLCIINTISGINPEAILRIELMNNKNEGEVQRILNEGKEIVMYLLDHQNTDVESLTYTVKKGNV